ncbi:ParB/RepB/Spo0J family partition protein [uncultured Tateyamaria sp.]|uniref:ParB/RepB/Spo0J family partition protein n=1 Tax=Tateyamaria sp. 1078 TaxID=3417464 RepID=UPI002603819C|nr:ParB/RepB/Spo0J family partition protein [uncultured Tateyamaria sp.]
MTDPLRDIPVTQIMPDALPRDRDIHDPEATAELEMSIALEGLRQPIELFELSEPHEGRRYGLISGHRRLAACTANGFDTIAAFLRQPADIPAALASMVAENEIRAQISPWEKGRLINQCLHNGLFETEDDAIEKMFRGLSRQKRTRLRSIVMAVQCFDGLFATPERLSIARIERLAAAMRAGWEDLLNDALRTARSDTLAGQWAALEPVIHEALNPKYEETAPDTPTAPRRSIKISHKLQIRREYAKSGWILRFSGPEARSPGLMDDVMEVIERTFLPGD